MHKSPSMDLWLREAKQAPGAANVGMYLIHNGTVRQTARALVRSGDESAGEVTGMKFSFDAGKVRAAEAETAGLPGIFYVRTWLNEGLLDAGDDIMYVMVGGDIRPHVIDALQFLVGTIKTGCVVESEIYRET